MEATIKSAAPSQTKSAESESYWKEYYHSEFLVDATPFGTFCQTNYLEKPQRIVELGCGSGRDVRLFSVAGHDVTAIDRCPVAIAKLEDEIAGVHFEEGDFTNLPDSDVPWDCVYSRWSLHSVGVAGAERTLDWAYRNLVEGGLICIEVRSINDHLYGEGEKVGEHAYVTDHYRRFIILDELRAGLTKRGFEVAFEIEDSGLSVYKGDDPVLIRLIARR